MQTVQDLLKKFNVNILLTDVISNKEIEGEFTRYNLNRNRDGNLQHILEGTVLTPRIHPDTLKRLPKFLKDKMSKGTVLENCKVIITPENKEEKYLYIETWSEKTGGFCIFYDSNGEERGRS